MKSGLKIGSAVALVGLIAFLFWRIESYKDAQQVQTQEIHRLEWLISAKEAENDTLRGIGQYTKPETTIVSRVRVIVDTLEGRIDTVYEDIPKIYGSIKIDTTRDFGPGSNPMKVRVAGEFWYPPEYSNRNWMLIHPIVGAKVPIMPVTTSQKSVGIGLNYLRSFNQHDFFGVSVRYKRFTVAGSYDPWRKEALATIGLNILRF